MLASVNNIQLIQLPFFPEENGSLVVLEGASRVPFDIARVFAVRAPANSIRGQHAHKACTQFLTCLNGCIELRCDDGYSVKSYLLDQTDKGLLVPPGIWVECLYKTPDSVLMVLCDRHYEEQDYIRDYDKFKAYRGTK